MRESEVCKVWESFNKHVTSKTTHVTWNLVWSFTEGQHGFSHVKDSHKRLGKSRRDCICLWLRRRGEGGRDRKWGRERSIVEQTGSASPLNSSFWNLLHFPHSVRAMVTVQKSKDSVQGSGVPFHHVHFRGIKFRCSSLDASAFQPLPSGLSHLNKF